MRPIDVNPILQELSSEQPCGEDLSYDPAFGELERSAQTKPEQQFGDTVVPAEEPDWPSVQGKALELLSRSRDLRAAAYLTEALLHTEGFTGFRDGLTLVKGLLEKHWDTVHPQLDPEDDNDPTIRINTILSLCNPDTVLRGIRETPLVRSRMLGQFSLRDVMIATGKLEAPTDGETSPPDATTVDAAFRDADSEELQERAASVDGALESIAAIQAAMAGKIGDAQVPDLGPLESILRDVRNAIAERSPESAAASPAASLGEQPAGAQLEAASVGGQPAVATGELRSRDDVIRTLDRVCAYFRAHEPSSPVPLLLERAKHLVSKDFMEIVRNLAPDGVGQVETIRGPEDGDGQ